MANEETKWGNPGAMGLAAFGFTTFLLQIHNIGLITSVFPLMYGFFWGGAAQVIAGIIDGKRGDTFGMTAFISFGFFWIGLSFAFLMSFLGVVKLDNPGLAWVMIAWGMFAFYMGIATLRISIAHVIVFGTLVILFALLALHFYGVIPAAVAGWEGLICAGSAIYTSAAVVLSDKYGRWVLPIGKLPRA
ncbi:MAG: acetate uptake transporter [Dehalococcoidales bacterium]|nr:acetate uptake transporter [Dehalococcoidales bacterium]